VVLVIVVVILEDKEGMAVLVVQAEELVLLLQVLHQLKAQELVFQVKDTQVAQQIHLSLVTAQ
tara:strand:- start:377 stop:565 length:189 start_codon:yes stop_codon:yes gene_type:complete